MQRSLPLTYRLDALMDAERIESIPHRWDGHGSRDRRATATDSGRPPRPKELVLARAWGHNPCARPAPPPACTLPANIAADDDVGQGHVSVLIECGTTPAVMGNSIGAVLTMRTTLPEPGVLRMAKNGRSRPGPR